MRPTTGSAMRALRDGYCEECAAASWKRAPKEVGMDPEVFERAGVLAFRGTFLVHSPGCDLGNFLLDHHEALRTLTIEVCWAEALLEHKERMAAPPPPSHSFPAVRDIAFAFDPWSGP